MPRLENKLVKDIHLEHCDWLWVKSPVMSLSHVVFVSEVHHPALLDCLCSNSFCLKRIFHDTCCPSLITDLLDALHQPLDGDVAVCGLGRQVGLEVAGGHDGGAVIHLRGVSLLVTLHPAPVLKVIGFLWGLAVNALGRQNSCAVVRNSFCTFLVSIIATIFALNSLFDNTHEELKKISLKFIQFKDSMCHGLPCCKSGTTPKRYINVSHKIA